MKTKILSIVIGVAVSAGLLASESASANPYDRRFYNGSARSEIRGDRRELGRDLREFYRDRAELSRDLRNRAPRSEIAQGRAEIRQDLREILQDRRELRGDRTEFLRDLYRNGWYRDADGDWHRRPGYGSRWWDNGYEWWPYFPWR